MKRVFLTASVAVSRYTHSTFFSLQLLHGLSSSHLVVRARQLSHAYCNPVRNHQESGPEGWGQI